MIILIRMASWCHQNNWGCLGFVLCTQARAEEMYSFVTHRHGSILYHVRLWYIPGLLVKHMYGNTGVTDCIHIPAASECDEFCQWYIKGNAKMQVTIHV